MNTPATVVERRPDAGVTGDGPATRGGNGQRPAADGNGGPRPVVDGNNGQGAAIGGNNGQRPATLGVRPAGASDLVPLTFFFDTVLRKDYFLRRGQLADMLGSPYHQVYVAEIDAILVGIAITTRGTRLVNALVHPAYRGLGVGKALVGFSGATEVRAKTDMSTGDPRGFYAALGFKATGDTNDKGNIEIMSVDKKRVRRGAAGGRALRAG
jgi:GNAT superfamily N-acetyltransferase